MKPGDELVEDGKSYVRGVGAVVDPLWRRVSDQDVERPSMPDVIP
jgi:hypothetical protein